MADNHGVYLNKDGNEIESITFVEGHDWFVVKPDKRGFEGSVREVVAGSPVDFEQSAYNTFSIGGGRVKCANHDARQQGAENRQDSVVATDNVIDSVTRDRIMEYFKRHPEDAKPFREQDIKLTIMNEQSANIGQLEEYPSQFRACPADKKNVIVERMK